MKNPKNRISLETFGKGDGGGFHMVVEGILPEEDFLAFVRRFIYSPDELDLRVAVDDLVAKASEHLAEAPAEAPAEETSEDRLLDRFLLHDPSLGGALEALYATATARFTTRSASLFVAVTEALYRASLGSYETSFEVDYEALATRAGYGTSSVGRVVRSLEDAGILWSVRQTRPKLVAFAPWREWRLADLAAMPRVRNPRRRRETVVEPGVGVRQGRLKP